MQPLETSGVDSFNSVSTTQDMRLLNNNSNARLQSRRAKLSIEFDVVYVDLGNGQFATIDAPIWDAFIKKGGSPILFLNDNGKGKQYVRFRSKTTGNNIDFSRVVKGLTDKERKKVIHIDENRLNLCSYNLHVRPKSKSDVATGKAFLAL